MTEYAAVFKRVSTDMTRQDITNQDADTDRLVAEVEGRAFHGKHDPSLREILADVKAGKYTVVVVAMTSRIDRRGPEYVMRFVWDLRATGGRIEAADNPMFGKGDFVGDMAIMFAAEGDDQYSYATEGETGRKVLIPGADAEIAREVFQRIADGRSASSVAAWLDDACRQVIKKTGKRSPWRAKRVIQMVQNPMCKGQHATHTGYEALVSVKVWSGANAAMSARSFDTGAAGALTAIRVPCS